MTFLNTIYKPPRPNSASAAKARRVELTMRRLLVKLANKNLKVLTIQTHKNADKYLGHPPRVSLFGILIKDDIIVVGCHGLCLNSSQIWMWQTTLLAHHITTMTEARWENCTRGDKTCGPGTRGECENVRGHAVTTLITLVTPGGGCASVKYVVNIQNMDGEDATAG